MIITKIQGGLGNQLFQYALGRNLALKNNTELKLDISFYDRQKKRTYLLNNFNTAENILSKEESVYFKKIQKKYSPSWFLNTINNKIFFLKENPNKYFQFNPCIINNNIQKDIYLEGYWQNEKYFVEIRELLLKEFTLKSTGGLSENSIFKKIKNTNSISVHFRRGDYLTEKKYYIPTLDYYKKAVSIMINNIGNADTHFFIFSDDIEWVKKEFKLDHPTTYVDDSAQMNDCEQLIAMSNCKHNIITNSSFSWWGAWLNNNKNKQIICPSFWTEPGKNNIEDLFPNNWIKI